ncbi:MAG: hypothetical protein ACI9WU_004419, partial [Myxococcota bacterium]
DDWLDSDAFAERVVRFHRDLLWNNVTNVNLSFTRASMRRTYEGPGDYTYWVQARAIGYRGDNLGCLNEPATFDANGTVQTTLFTAADGDVSYREGYVMVEPFWAPGTLLKVCALDAQPAAVSPNGTACHTREGTADVGCGCGDELKWCKYGSVNRDVTAGMARDIELRIAQIIKEDRPYTELFTGTTGFVNGPMVHHLKHRATFHANFRLEPLSVDLADLPDLDPTDTETFVEVDMGSAHAGILTSWAFLARFQTNRARANRFYTNFMCQPFSPPQGGIPINEEEALVPDLQKRGGCKYCHSLLEPSASFWGRWTEGGAGFLAPAEFPASSDECYTCATIGQQCSTMCNTFYLTKMTSLEQAPYLGKLLAYEFRRPEHEINVEVGPKVLALTATVDHRMPTCVAYKTANWLLGRPLGPQEGAWLDTLALEFVTGDYSYRDLVKAIVTSDVYRRVR